jgi:hypothetical protein
LGQDPGREEMQIEVVDDVSLVDDPEPVVRRVAGGRVSFSRNLRNLGLIPNFNNCVQRARGYWVHILHTRRFCNAWILLTVKNRAGSAGAI